MPPGQRRAGFFDSYHPENRMNKKFIRKAARYSFDHSIYLISNTSPIAATQGCNALAANANRQSGAWRQTSRFHHRPAIRMARQRNGST
jgi:hypothetical protein